MLPFLFLGLALVDTINAYSFTVASTPTQCQPFTIELAGEGTPPYTLLLIPYGDPPGGHEVRKLTSQTFNGTTTTVDQLAFPSNAQFLAMVNDATSVGSGGTSISINVQTSNDTSCLPTSVTPDFFLFAGSLQATSLQINQCQALQLAWSATATGPVTIYGVLPGGNSFNIETSSASAISSTIMGFNWTVDVPSGTDIILLAGDSRGPGTGGSTNLTNVGGGPSSCLTGTYPSSTPGTPAGQVFPTSSPTSSGTSEVGPIVGGVIGGVLFILLVLLLFFFCYYRNLLKNRRASLYEKPDLIPEHTADGQPATGEAQHLPQGYQPDPFIVPNEALPFIPGDSDSRRNSHFDLPSSSGSASGTGLYPPHPDRRHSGGSSRLRSSADYYNDDARTSITGTSYDRDRKTHYGPTLRPVNIIQHEDAGEVPSSSAPQDEEEPETVELPPSYASVRPSRDNATES